MGTLKMGRLHSLDVVKGIAIIMVILCHSLQRFKELPEIFGYFSFGQFGCSLFFMVSGYTVAVSCNKYCPSIQNWSGIRQYYSSRYISIAPCYYLMMLVTFVLNTLSLAVIDATIGFGGNREALGYLVNILFLHGFSSRWMNSVVGGGWYMGTAVVLFALGPWLYFTLKKCRLVALILAGIGISALSVGMSYYLADITKLVQCKL